MTDFGLGDEVTNEDKRQAAIRWHFGTYYYQPEKPLLAQGLTPRQICARLGVNKSSVSVIAREAKGEANAPVCE